jgi:putative transposase
VLLAGPPGRGLGRGLHLGGDLVGSTVYVAFVLDCHSRRILGWRASTSMRTELVLDALEQALWTRAREGVTDLSGLVCHHDAGSQYPRLRSPSGWPPPAPHPASAPSATRWTTPWPRPTSGCSRPSLIGRRGPWRGLDDVELATLEGVDWHNNRRLHTACHDLTPVEYEQVFYGSHPAQQRVEVSTP